MPRTPHKTKLTTQVGFRLTSAQLAKLDEVAERFRVDRAQVMRWWLDEMPEKYVPAAFKGGSR